MFALRNRSVFVVLSLVATGVCLAKPADEPQTARGSDTSAGANTWAEQTFRVVEGIVDLQFDAGALSDAGLTLLDSESQGLRVALDAAPTGSMTFLRLPQGMSQGDLSGGLDILGAGFVLEGRQGTRVSLQELRIEHGSWTADGRPMSTIRDTAYADQPLLNVVWRASQFDAGQWQGSADITLSPSLADALDVPAARDAVIGTATVSLRMILNQTTTFDADGNVVSISMPGAGGGGAPEGGTVCNRLVGPDVIVGVLPSIANYTAVGSVEAFSVATTSCNVGDVNLQWQGSNTNHPAIGQTMYRLADGRFEQIGQSFLKHGFTALTQNECGCGCSGQGGSVLGVGCSDPYSATRNGDQNGFGGCGNVCGGLGPKFEVNPNTGGFSWPYAFSGQSGDSIYKRLQVKITDLDPALDGGGSYFVGAQYVTPDDAANGNQNNNASYRPCSITGSGTAWSASLTGTTQREQSPIRAWQDNDATVTEAELQVPGDGLAIVAYKTTDLGGGIWNYEYAVENLNVHRGFDSFSIPVDASAVVTSIGFHDVDYHSGDGEGGVTRDGTDWAVTSTGGAVTWNLVPAGGNDNALLWGTLYNFRFNVNAAPTTSTATLGLWRTGSPGSVAIGVQGPVTGPQDCNGNGVDDVDDIANGTSQDCAGGGANGVPDECETMCNLRSRQVASGLSSPIHVASDGVNADRLYIVERPGRIKILDLGTETVSGTNYLDISSLTTTDGERGLLSIAFHPSFGGGSPFVFVNYTNLAGNTVVARYTATGSNPAAVTVDSGSALILKTIVQDFSNHNGGQLQFGLDGMLYVGMGDGGSGDDPFERAQDDGSLLGKMLRLNVDIPAPYVPVDNPFVGAGLPLDEIWAKGLRNPWRFSFDALTGDMYIGDVGQSAREEIDFQPASSTGGENYGWDCREGLIASPAGGDDCTDPPYVDPILDIVYGTAGTCAITGGQVYRGCDIPGLSGTYFYSDSCGDWIRSFSYVDGDPVPPVWTDRTSELTPLTGSISQVVSFGEDINGELYWVNLTGSVYKIECMSTCGNSIVEPSEECDPPDGITCDANCQDIAPCDATTFADDFETNQGWVATNLGATSGDWQRGVPVNDPGWDFDPTSDADGSGQCYLTQNQIGNTDVDAGSVRLTSPILDMSGGNVTITYWYYLRLTNSDGVDALVVEISSNGAAGPWIEIARHDTDGGLNWRESVITPAALTTAGVTTTSNMQMRFTANDGNTQSIVEAGLDAFDVCSNITDCNNNGVPDDQDIANQTSDDCNTNGIPDECEVGVPPCPTGDYIFGGEMYDNWWAATGATEPVADHPLWAFRPDTVTNTATGSATWRCKECHGWDYLGAAGQYGPTSTHHTGFPGVLGSLLTANDLRTLLTEPSDNPGPGVPNGHDFGSTDLTTQQIEDLIAFVLGGGAIDDSPFINATTGAFNGDAVTGMNNYTGAGSCTICHGSDGATINFSGDCFAPEYVGTIATQNPWELLHKIRFRQPGSIMPSWEANGGSIQGAADIGEYAQASLAVECAIGAPCTQCDDTNECTDDSCDGRFCTTVDNTNLCMGGTGICQAGVCSTCSEPCSDGDACTIGDSCGGGPICAGSPVDCGPFGDDCNVATCDAGGADGNCAILTPANEGGPCNAGSGICESGACVAMCTTAADCADVVADGVTDDVCIWWECNAGVCSGIAKLEPSDFGGAFGDCALDGFCNLSDALHALTCFSGDNACDSINIDGGGAFGDCAPDGFCNLADALHALTCFSGDNTCVCGPSPDVTPGPNVVGRTTLSIVTAGRAIKAGDEVQVRFFVDRSLPSFGAYQLDTRVSGGRSGALELLDVTIEDRADFVFAGADGVFDAFNVGNGQMLSGLFNGDVATGRRGYLATFTYRASEDASGTFVVDVLHDDANRDQTYLVGAQQTDKIEVTSTSPAVIVVTTGSSRSIR